MKLSEAHKILGVNPSASKEESKQAFRKLAAKFHPDNKDTGSSDEFKKINSAWQIIDNPGKAEPETPKPAKRYNVQEHLQDLDDLIREARRRQKDPFADYVKYNSIQTPVEPPPQNKGDIEISFAEAALGCVKEIQIQKMVCCTSCSINTYKGCSKCRGARVMPAATVYKVTVPAGVTDGQAIRLAQAGDYFPNLRVEADALITVKVRPEDNMTIEGEDIVSSIDLTLLEALKGTNKKVNTIKGELTLKIHAGVKNGDKIQAKNYGVAQIGSHIFVLNVEYPKDTKALIDLLESNKEGI